MSWNETTIGAHCTVTSSKRFHLSERCSSGVPFYCSKEIIQKTKNEQVAECDYIDESLYEEIRRKYGVPQCGDLLITTRGTYGIPYIYKDTDRFYFADGNLTWLKDFDSKLSASFLYYWILSHEGQKKIDAIAKGTAQKAVPISAIKDIKFAIPPIEVQERIAEILSAYDGLIENNQRQIKLLEEAAQRLYKEWFVDLYFPGYENTPVVDGVPEGWKRERVQNVSSVLRRGISPKYSELGNSTVINQKCIRQSILDLSEARTQEKEYPSELNLQDSDTVICSTGAGTLGRVGQVFGNYPNTTFDSHVTLVRANDSISKQYLYLFLKSKQAYLMGMGKGSTNQLELNRSVIQELPILIPRRDLLDKFESLVESIHNKISMLNRQIIDLKDARDCLLPRLMSGEIEA